MLSTFTAQYREISSGYMGQIVEWPEVVTDKKRNSPGKGLTNCVNRRV
jgi:hypothetical protein